MYKDHVHDILKEYIKRSYPSILEGYTCTSIIREDNSWRVIFSNTSTNKHVQFIIKYVERIVQTNCCVYELYNDIKVLSVKFIKLRKGIYGSTQQ